MPANTNKRAVRIPKSGQLVTPAVETNVDPGMHDDGSAAVFDQAANEFGKMAGRVGALADKAAAKEGQDAGYQAGLDPEFRPTKNLSIRGSAFDAAGISIAGRRLRMAMSADMSAAAKKYGDDPGALQKALNGRFGGYLKQAQALSPKLAASLQLSYRQSSLGLVRSATRKRVAKTVAAERATAEDDIVGQFRDLERAANKGGLDEEATALLASQKTQLAEALNAKGIDGKLLFSPVFAKRKLRKADDLVNSARITGAFDRSGTLEAKEKFIELLKPDWQEKKGVASNFSQAGIEQLEHRLTVKLKRLQHEQAIEEKTALKAIEKVTEMGLKGYSLTDEQLEQVEAKVVATGNEQLYDAFDAATNEHVFVQKLQHLSPVELKENIDQGRALLREHGVTPQRLARIETAEQVFKAQETALKTEPWGYIKRTGMMKVPRLNFEDPQSLVRHEALRQQASSRLGREIPYFSNEQKQLAITAMRSHPEMAHKMVMDLASGLGLKSQKIFSELKHDAPGYAALGTLAYYTGDKKMVLYAARGLHLMGVQEQDGKPGFKSRVSDKLDIDAITKRVLGDSFMLMPESYKGFDQLARGIAEMDARYANHTQITDKGVELAIHKALGQRIVDGKLHGGLRKFNGHTIIVPTNVQTDHFDNILAAVTDKHLLTMGATHTNGKPLSAADLRRATLVSVGHGKYMVAMGDVSSGNPEYIKGEGHVNGTWIMDFNQILEKTNHGVGYLPPTSQSVLGSHYLESLAKVPKKYR